MTLQKHLTRKPIKAAIRHLEDIKMLHARGIDITNKIDETIKMLTDELERARSAERQPHAQRKKPA